MDDSNIRQTALRQYRAGLAMLGEAMERCPEDLWYSNEDKNRFWHIAYHSLFYTHLYVQPSEGDFRPWSKHVPDANYLGPRLWRRTNLSKFPNRTTSRTCRNIWSSAGTRLKSRRR